jgi:Mrp family chromosome partitioning ATPase
VIIDSSPVMVVSDPRIVCRYVDETLFVVRWAFTRREHALFSLKQIFEAGGQVGGIVLSMVNVHRHAQYAFSDSGQYRIGQRYYER